MLRVILSLTFGLMLLDIFNACDRSRETPIRFPTEAQVQVRIRPGMTRSEIIQSFGKPTSEEFAQEGRSQLIYMSPDFLLPNRTVGQFAGFQVFLKDGKVVEWSPVRGDTHDERPFGER